MYYVIVPFPVVLIDHTTGERMKETIRLANGVMVPSERDKPPMTLFRLIVEVAFNDVANFGTGWKSSLALKAIYEKFKDAEPGHTVALEDEHIERLRKSLLGLDGERPIYNPMVLMQIDSLLRAVKDAMDDEDYKKSVLVASK